MLKITIEVKQNKDNESCKLVMTPPTEKQIADSSKNEKICMQNVINSVTNALKELENQSK